MEQFHANASQHTEPERVLSRDEKIAAAGKMMKGFGAVGFPYESVSRVNDIELPGRAGRIPARLYVPKAETSAQNSAPVLVYYHGGGFIGGDFDRIEPTLAITLA